MLRTPKRIQPSCYLWGESFSPGLLSDISGIELLHLQKAGEVAVKGKYRNRARPYGSCHIIMTEDLQVEDEISWLAKVIVQHRATIDQTGATKIQFHIYWYGNQGNMELSVAQLNNLAAVSIPLVMDYHYTDE